jgi:4-amino-4-deoxy-L-arabinose transferase-like glycosyltransferase
MDIVKPTQRGSNFVLANFLTKFLFLFLVGLQTLGITKNLSRFLIILLFTVSLSISIKTEKITFKKIFKKVTEFQKVLSKLWHSHFISKLQIILLSLVTTCTSVIAVFAPPNNWDSMTYHLPRMEHWFQNQSMWFYETNIDRQLWMQSFNSHLFLIPKAFKLPEFSYNFIQLIAFVLILTLTSQILNSSNKPKEMILSIALILATIPNLIVQAPTTQSDVLAGFALLLNFIYLKEIIEGNQERKISILYGMSFAIAAFSKGTLFPYLAISGLYVITKTLVHSHRKFPLSRLNFIAYTLILNGFTWIQAYANFGTISGPQTTKDRFVQSPLSSGFSPMDITAAFIHFIANNLQSYSHELNTRIFELTYKISHFLNVDLLANSNSWPNWNPSDGTFTNIFQTSFGVNEDAAVSPILILLLFAMMVLEYKLIKNRNYSILTLNSIILLYYVLTIIVLRWNLFLDRYFIPVSVLSTICIALGISNRKRNIKILISVSLVATIYSLPFVIRSEIRPLIGSESIFSKSYEEKRFTHKNNLLVDYLELNRTIDSVKPSSLEISIGGDDWEFPIWSLANQKSLEVYDYRDDDELKGSKPLLICYVDCKLAPPRENTFIIMKPIPDSLMSESQIKMNAGINPKVLIEGWGETENWGIWSISNQAKLRFNVNSKFFENTDVVLETRSLIIPRTLRNMEIIVNNQHYQTYDLNNFGEFKSIKIDANFLKQFIKDQTIQIEFRFSNLLSPRQAGFSSDDRLLGIGLMTVSSVTNNG